MKRNVDLSESRMFTTPEEPTGIFKLLLDSIKVTKPWDFEHKPIKVSSDSEDYRLFNSQSLIPVGNKKERENWKRNQAYDTDQICDWCGQDRGKKPWAKNRCNCYSMTYTPKIPWKF